MGRREENKEKKEEEEKTEEGKGERVRRAKKKVRGET